MKWERFKRKNLKRCNNCGASAILVCSNLLFGNICSECYHKYYKQGKIKTINGFNLTRAENILCRNEYTRLIGAALIDVYSRYIARLVYVGDDRTVKLETVYKNQPAIIELKCIQNNNENIVVYKVINKETSKLYVTRAFKFDADKKGKILMCLNVNKSDDKHKEVRKYTKLNTL